MARYRKRPVVVEAEQWLPNRNGELPVPPAPANVLRQTSARWQIRTIEGWLDLTPRDWIIRGVAGEHYPCKPEVFTATYDKVEE
jgi:hypothetical protein